MNQIKTPTARRGLPLLLALSLLLAILTGCGGQVPDSGTGQPGQQTKEPADKSPEPTPAPKPEPEPVELALRQYRTIVGQADTYDYNSTDDPTGAYRYALVRMAPEDDIPALLLEQDTTFGISFVLVFRYDADNKTVLQASDTLMEGVASAGSYRGGLSAAGDGNGLLSTEFSSGSGQGYTSRVALDGDTLRSEIIWEGSIFDDTDKTVGDIGSIDINWHDVSDTSALDGWTPDAPQPIPTPAEPTGETAALPTDGNRIVFRGTLHSYTYDEVVALQGEPDPNAQWADTSEVFWLILPEEPQTMSLGSSGGGGFTEGTVDIISVTYSQGMEQLKQYEGQQLVYSIDPNTTWWPSDTSLPLGKPLAIGEIHVLQ